MYCVQIDGYEQVYLSSKTLCEEYIQYLQIHDNICDDEWQIIKIECQDDIIKNIMLRGNEK